MSEPLCGALKAENCLNEREVGQLETIAELLAAIERKDAAIAELVGALIRLSNECDVYDDKTLITELNTATALIAKYDK